MKLFELLYCMLEWAMPVHHVKVRRILRQRCAGPRPKRLLDVGGRKSPYTIAVNCEVDVLDLPRNSEMQSTLNLGLNEMIMSQIRERRSNISSIILEDVTKTMIPDNSYDVVVAVEVIEHIADDSSFVQQIHRVLKPNGYAVLTTPNGETKRNTNPDHLRHYTRAELELKLREQFEDVDVFYGVRQGYLHRIGMRGWMNLRPSALWNLFCRVVANLIEPHHRTRPGAFNQLFAIARKSAACAVG